MAENINNYINYTNTIETKEKDISFSYVKLMTDLGKYHVSLTEYDTLSEEEQEENEKIEKVTNFNIVVYSEVHTALIGNLYATYSISNDNYNAVSVNGYKLENIAEVSSQAIYGVNDVAINFSPDYIENYDSTQNYVVDIYLTLETTEIDEHGEEYLVANPLFYQIIFKGAEEEKEEENETPNNEWIIDPEAIIGEDDYNKDSSTGYDFNISEREYERYVFLNGASYYDLYTAEDDENIVHDGQDYTMNGKKYHSGFTLYCFDKCIRLHVDPSCIKEFDITIICIQDNVGHPVTVHYAPNILNTTGNKYLRAQKMNAPNVSFSLLRVNPKLTGNVKVVVDSNSNLYLDTFKVSTSLEQKQHRHIALNINEYYGQTLMTKFKDVPSTDFYKVENKCYNLFTTAQSYNSQYYDMYRYGVKTNDDKMYNENFALLAPLCIKEIVPDFFLIFKVDTTALDYDEKTMSDNEKIKYFINKGQIIKSYDMRKDSPIEKYIRAIYEHSKNYPGDAYISYSSSNYNRFIGISLDRGVVTSAYESTFDEEHISNQVEMNDFYTEGFERNRLVSRNIINFEFMFDDTSSELFSIDTYFGLYVKVNEENNTFCCIDKKITAIESDEELEPEYSIEYVFDKDIHTFDTSLNLTSIKGYDNIIYGLTTPKGFTKLHTGLNYSNEISEYLLKPYKNILTAQVKKFDANTFKSFITFKLNKMLEVGDHIRIIDIESKEIFDVVTSNLNFFDDEYEVSESTTTYYKRLFNEYTIYYVSMHIPFRTEYAEADSETISSIINQQAEQLYHAFSKFKTESFIPYKVKDSNISIVGNKENLVFERIAAPSGFTDEQKVYLSENEEENSTITFYNNISANKVILDIETSSWIQSPYMYLYPLYFEVVGNRMAHIMSFVKISSITNKNLIYTEIEDLSIFDNTLVYYEYENNEYYSNLYKPIEITTFINYGESSDSSKIKTSTVEQNSIPFFGDFNKQILLVKNPQLNNGIFKLFSCYPLNAGICSFFQLKDFDFNVLDNSKSLTLSEEQDTIGNPGEFCKKTLFNYPPEKEEESVDATRIEGSEYYYIHVKPDEIVTGSIELIRSNDIDIDGPAAAMFSMKYDELLQRNIASASAYYIIHGLEDPSKGNGRVLSEEQIDYGDYTEENLDSPYYDNVFDIDVICSQEFITYVIGSKLGVAPNDGKEESDINDSTLISDILTDEYIASILSSVSDDESPTAYGKFVKQFLTACLTIGLETYGQIALESIITKLIEYRSTLEEDTEEYNNYENLMYSLVGYKKIGYYRPIPNFFDDPAELYSESPLRTTPEESIKDYIDKHRQFLNENDTVSDYFKTLFNENHTSSDISLVSPHACKWAGIGTDARGESIRIMHDYVDESGKSILSTNEKEQSYFAVGSKTYSNYLGYLYSELGSDDLYFKKYIPKSLNQLTYNYKTDSKLFGVFEKDNVLNENGNLDDILYSAKDFSNKFSVVYNSGEDTIEFISSGVKFRIKTNNNDAIDVSKYNGYSAIFISLPDINRDYGNQTELIIDETTKEMMIVWYQSVNTFKYGMKYYQGDNIWNLSSYMCRINYNHTIKDVKCTYYNSLPIAMIPDDNKFGTYENNESNKIGKRLIKKEGYIWLGTSRVDDSTFTKYNRLILTGKLSYNTPREAENMRFSYPYYLYDGYITVNNPVWWNNYHQSHANNTDIASDSYDYHPSHTALLFTDSAEYIVNNIGTFDMFKTALNSISVFIKTQEGKKDYTTYENLINVDIVEPLEYIKYEGIYNNVVGKKEIKLGYVHSSFAEPVYKDMLVFDYTSNQQSDSEEADLLDDIFEKSFDGANISIAGVNTIDQIWFNKYTTEFNYCVVESTDEENNKISVAQRTSLGLKKNISLMNDAWAQKLYRKYNIVKSQSDNIEYEEEELVAGYKTGYELKTFIHGRGINLNGSDGSTMEISSWKNTQISEENKYIKIDITDSIIYNILFKKAFYKYWNYLNLTDNTYKINYIKTSIIPFININNKTKFMLYKGTQINNQLYFFNELDEAKGDLISNYKNELRYENGKYYMYVYPEEMTSYYAKMIIDL